MLPQASDARDLPLDLLAVLLGDYEVAAFTALREVEIRVRDLAHEPASALGVPLMRKAFNEKGLLRDPGVVSGEGTAMMDLFAGSIGAFKNPTSHRTVEYTDPTEASEVVLLADLLLRLLDRVALRLEESRVWSGADE